MRSQLQIVEQTGEPGGGGGGGGEEEEVQEKRLYLAKTTYLAQITRKLSPHAPCRHYLAGRF